MSVCVHGMCVYVFMCMCVCVHGMYVCVHGMCVYVFMCMCVCVHGMCVCVYGMCVYVYMVCVCMCTWYVYVYMVCVCMCTCVCVCMCTWYVHVCAHVCVCMCTWCVCVYVYMVCVCVHVYVYMCVCVHGMCMYVYMYVCVCVHGMCVCMCTCVCVHVYVYVYMVCVCMCTCVCVCVCVCQVVNQEELGGVQEVTHIDGDHITQEITMDGSDLGIEVPMEITAQDDQPVAMATTSGAMEGSMEGVVIDNGQVSASTTPTLALVSAAMATSMAEGSVIGADALAEAGTSMEPGVIATNMHGGIVTETGAMATSALECVETIETGEVTTTVVNMEASDVQTVQYIE